MDPALAMMTTAITSTENPKLTEPFNLTGPWDNTDRKIGK